MVITSAVSWKLWQFISSFINLTQSSKVIGFTFFGFSSSIFARHIGHVLLSFNALTKHVRQNVCPQFVFAIFFPVFTSISSIQIAHVSFTCVSSLLLPLLSLLLFIVVSFLTFSPSFSTVFSVVLVL